MRYTKRSESVGRPNDGRLLRGRMLPPGAGYKFKGRAGYGTDETIATLIWVVGRVLTRYPASADLIIKDISREHGGRFRPHKSHQSGRDVDLGYYVRENARLRNFKHTSPRTIDGEKTWYLIEQLLRTGQVRMIFIDHPLQAVLYDHARRSGWREADLAAIFEYPQRRNAKALIRHIRGHANHMHVRFRCAASDSRCVD